MDGLFDYLCSQLSLCLYTTISVYTDYDEKKSLAIYPKEVLTTCTCQRIDHFLITHREGFCISAVVFQNNQVQYYPLPNMNFAQAAIPTHEEVRDVLLRAICEFSY